MEIDYFFNHQDAFTSLLGYWFPLQILSCLPRALKSDTYPFEHSTNPFPLDYHVAHPWVQIPTVSIPADENASLHIACLLNPSQIKDGGVDWHAAGHLRWIYHIHISCSTSFPFRASYMHLSTQFRLRQQTLSPFKQPHRRPSDSGSKGS